MEFAAIEVPIKIDQNGVARVGGTRVTLETVVGAFRRGDTAEEIMIGFPSLKLKDIYTVIAYYLCHREEVDTYIDQMRLEGKKLLEENQMRHEVAALREKLLAIKRERHG